MMKHISEFLSLDNYFGLKKDWGNKILCPVCRNINVSFKEPVFKVSDSYGSWEGRGSAIKIPMDCEEGHKWILRIGFHKETTYIACESSEKVEVVIPIILDNEQN